MGQSRREREVTLAIIAPDAQKIADEIAELTTLSGLRLSARPDLELRDVYYDSPERVLLARKFALRIRRSDDRTWVALKGPEQLETGGETSRSELEARSSVQQLEHIAGRLKREGIDLDLDVGSSAAETLRQSGLVPIQDRETFRRRRRVDSPSDTKELLAELAIDNVLYHVAGVSLRHFEIEIESAGLRGIEALGELADGLQQRWAGALRDWHHSKLLTGLALEELSASGSFVPEQLGPGGALPTAAYDQLDEHLQDRG